MTATMQQTAPWERNAQEHADERLVGPRGDWWYTGPVPEPGRCPGVEADGTISSLAMPDLSVCGREEALAYFDNSWALQETLFAGLQDAAAFYRPPDHGLRHPLIFYYGHPPVLYVNKLRVAGLVAEPVDAYLEDVLETGVDEMSWDDMSKNEMTWPSVARVHAYRAEVYRLVRGIIENTDFAPDLGRPVGMGDQAWAVFLAFEHDRIHLETSSVLIRELPLEFVTKPAAWPDPAPSRRTGTADRPDADSYPVNETVAVAGGAVRLGKPWEFPSFGWDNEYGTRGEQVDDFEAARMLVSNGEYHEFVVDGGYRRPELWSDEGEQWRRFRNTKWPRWWVQAGPTGLHAFRLRTTFDEIEMPWDWPVCVNYHEAKAFLTWRSERDGRSFRLPTEAEFRLLRALPEDIGPGDDPVLAQGGAALREQGINLNLAHGSEGPVDASPVTPQGVHDAAGNLWSWSEDVAHPYDGFETHPYYEDFSTPCFDGLHQMILGGCFVSTGDQASIWARYHFRAHFLQQAGIRAVAGSSDVPSVVSGTGSGAGSGADDTYERPEMLDRYLLMHFGTVEETFERAGHPLAGTHGYPQRIADLLAGQAHRAGVRLDRVLDIGCAVGGTAFALAEHGADVVGLDASAPFVDTARLLAGGTPVEYNRPDQGDAVTRLVARAPRTRGAVSFVEGDAERLGAGLGTFDAVVLANLLDRLGDPAACLDQLAEGERILRRGGLLLVATPWSWKAEHTERAAWIGGGATGPRSEDALRTLLGASFELVAETSETGSLRDHRRHFEFLEADVTVWRKR